MQPIQARYTRIDVWWTRQLFKLSPKLKVTIPFLQLQPNSKLHSQGESLLKGAQCRFSLLSTQ